VLSVFLRFTDSDYLPLISSNSSHFITTIVEEFEDVHFVSSAIP
jgi:hypothetical protein